MCVCLCTISNTIHIQPASLLPKTMNKSLIFLSYKYFRYWLHHYSVKRHFTIFKGGKYFAYSAIRHTEAHSRFNKGSHQLPILHYMLPWWLTRSRHFTVMNIPVSHRFDFSTFSTSNSSNCPDTFRILGMVVFASP